MSKKSQKKRRKEPDKSNSLLKVVIGLILIVAAAYAIYQLTRESDKKPVNPEQNLREMSSFKFKKQGELTFNSQNGDYLSTIDIEIADNDETRTLGLMYRPELGEKQGMLFIFPEERYQSFWMRNTFIPLDIIFVNKNREIVTIHKETMPFAEVSYPSDEPAIYVVEVKGGYTEKHGINEGDRIVWRRN
jgi:uncharacterized membrane protein (UPF0127 family)